MPRRNDTIWFTSDERFIELMHVLTHPEQRWAYPERPDILEALDELIAWANDSRDYDQAVHESGWRSAINDFLVTTDSLGSKTKQVIQSRLDAVRNLCQPNVGGDQALRAQLSTEAAALRQTLGTTPALMAAWTDLVRIIDREESRMNIVSVRRDNFWAIVRAVDLNTVELSRWLTSVLTGDPFEELRARLLLGEIDRIDGDRHSIRDSTPFVHPMQRLNLATRLLRTEPTSKTHIVWFAFRRAGLTRTIQEFGAIRLFEAQWLRANLLQGSPFKDEIPSELRNFEDANTIPNQRDVVLASVDLGTGTFADAVRIASERLDAFVGMSTIGTPIPWERIPGFIHVQDGRIAGNQFFVYEDDSFESPHALEYTAARITSMAPRVAPRLPVSDQGLRDIIDSLHWWRTGPSQPTAASIILNVRIIELVASRIGETTWTTYLENYFKNAWIHSAIMQILYMALHEALTRHLAPEVQPTQREIFLDVTEYRDGQQRFNTGKAARHLNTIIQFIPPDLPLGRDLRAIKQRTSNADAIRAWCAELETLWGGSIYRLERVRNAIAHGGPFTEQAVLLTQPFSQTMAVWALWESVEGFLDGKTLIQSYEDYRSRWDQWRSSMQTATSINDLFDNVVGPE